MNEKEIKEQLLAAGATKEQLDSLNFTKIEEIFDDTKDVDGICKDIKKAFPNFDEAGFRKIIFEQAKDSENTENLSDEALEEVAGGSVTTWMHRNKDWVITAAALATIGACVLYKKYTEHKLNSWKAKPVSNGPAPVLGMPI